LRNRLKEFGVSVEFGVELVNVVQDESDATATLKHAADQREESVKAKYLVGADGARGTLSVKLGQAATDSFAGASRKLAGVQFLGETSKEYVVVKGEAELTGLDKKVSCRLVAARV
jgi:2-polyprenyl-6-methoxyphenol hydroxylase-like FAD-dependent oxidoreductase